MSRVIRFGSAALVVAALSLAAAGRTTLNVPFGATPAVLVARVAAAPGPRFQIDLAGQGSVHIECFIDHSRLDCSVYDPAVPPPECDFEARQAGRVPGSQESVLGMVLDRRDSAHLEGFGCDSGGIDWFPDNWDRLEDGATFRGGVFRCRARISRTTLRCWSTVSGFRFDVASDGQIRTGCSRNLLPAAVRRRQEQKGCIRS